MLALHWLFVLMKSKRCAGASVWNVAALNKGYLYHVPFSLNYSLKRGAGHPQGRLHRILPGRPALTRRSGNFMNNPGSWRKPCAERQAGARKVLQLHRHHSAESLQLMARVAIRAWSLFLRRPLLQILHLPTDVLREQVPSARWARHERFDRW